MTDLEHLLNSHSSPRGELLTAIRKAVLALADSLGVDTDEIYPLMVDGSLIEESDISTIHESE